MQRGAPDFWGPVHTYGLAWGLQLQKEEDKESLNPPPEPTSQTGIAAPPALRGTQTYGKPEAPWHLTQIGLPHLPSAPPR